MLAYAVSRRGLGGLDARGELAATGCVVGNDGVGVRRHDEVRLGRCVVFLVFRWRRCFEVGSMRKGLVRVEYRESEHLSSRNNFGFDSAHVSRQ